MKNNKTNNNLNKKMVELVPVVTYADTAKYII